MFPLEKKQSIAYLRSPLLSQCDFLVHAFCTRLGGASEDDYASLNMSFREGDEEFRVLRNWDKLATAFDIPIENFLVLNQVHGDAIFLIKPHGEYFHSREQLNYDAIVTNRTNLAVCIKTADCVPVFLADRVKKIIAVVHAGWRGTSLSITAKAVRTMQSQYGSVPRDLLAAIGPSIGSCCYEIDEAAASAFRCQGNPEPFLRPGQRKNRWMLDLTEANRSQLRNAGIAHDHIDISGWCTKCRQDTLFSHRGSGGVTGRQVNFMMIRGDAPCRVLNIHDDLQHVH